MSQWRRERGLVLRVVLPLAILTGCDDPLRPIQVPTAVNPALMVLLVLEPGTPVQPAWITATDIGDDAAPVQPVVEIRSGGRLVARAERGHENDACLERLGGVIATNSSHACVQLRFDPVPGTSYSLRVADPARRTASATLTVPGDFELLAVEGRGYPPGTAGLVAMWTQSVPASGYFVGLRSENLNCPNVKGCEGGWYAITSDTVIDAMVPGEALAEGAGPWWLDVYALTPALELYLTTGSGDNLFPVQPATNIEGGYGVFGAWIRRTSERGL